MDFKSNALSVVSALTKTSNDRFVFQMVIEDYSKLCLRIRGIIVRHVKRIANLVAQTLARIAFLFFDFEK